MRFLLVKRVFGGIAGDTGITSLPELLSEFGRDLAEMKRFVEDDWKFSGFFFTETRQPSSCKRQGYVRRLNCKLPSLHHGFFIGICMEKETIRLVFVLSREFGVQGIGFRKKGCIPKIRCAESHPSWKKRRSAGPVSNRDYSSLLRVEKPTSKQDKALALLKSKLLGLMEGGYGNGLAFVLPSCCVGQMHLVVSDMAAVREQEYVSCDAHYRSWLSTIENCISPEERARSFATAKQALDTATAFLHNPTVCTAPNSALHFCSGELASIQRNLTVNVAVNPQNNMLLDIELKCAALEGEGIESLVTRELPHFHPEVFRMDAFSIHSDGVRRDAPFVIYLPSLLLSRTCATMHGGKYRGNTHGAPRPYASNLAGADLYVHMMEHGRTTGLPDSDTVACSLDKHRSFPAIEESLLRSRTSGAIAIIQIRDNLFSRELAGTVSAQLELRGARRGLELRGARRGRLGAVGVIAFGLVVWILWSKIYFPTPPVPAFLDPFQHQAHKVPTDAIPAEEITKSRIFWLGFLSMLSSLVASIALAAFCHGVDPARGGVLGVDPARGGVLGDGAAQIGGQEATRIFVDVGDAGVANVLEGDAGGMPEEDAGVANVLEGAAAAMPEGDATNIVVDMPEQDAAAGPTEGNAAAGERDTGAQDECEGEGDVHPGRCATGDKIVETAQGGDSVSMGDTPAEGDAGVMAHEGDPGVAAAVPLAGAGAVLLAATGGNAQAGDAQARGSSGDDMLRSLSPLLALLALSTLNAVAMVEKWNRDRIDYHHLAIMSAFVAAFSGFFCVFGLLTVIAKLPAGRGRGVAILCSSMVLSLASPGFSLAFQHQPPRIWVTAGIYVVASAFPLGLRGVLRLGFPRFAVGNFLPLGDGLRPSHGSRYNWVCKLIESWLDEVSSMPRLRAIPKYNEAFCTIRCPTAQKNIKDLTSPMDEPLMPRL
ncbi:hypothetical protein SELMODRAFT_425345 [Selaginella moellendorffii]|uniref:Uncharacterized protein n=1 Tax=Selaginella moellendorffii TaxID=88036 RepID=D8SST3_SELML|nr:hypothetical protein SELMODRAFT_425345 [Selaginella moellendorffii]